MSRVRQELSVVQFQVESRQASASMDALRERAKKLDESITETDAKIKALGNVPPSDAGLIEFQKTLKGLKSDLNDVTRAQNELMKGVKAADKLWKAAATGTMESLSMKEIKAGQRGMQARIQNLQPGGAENEKMLRAMRAAIEEGDIAIRRFEADVDGFFTKIAKGGETSVSEMNKMSKTLQDLISIEAIGGQKAADYKAQLDMLNATMRQLSEEEKRAAGAEVLAKAQRGNFATANMTQLADVIRQLKEYQAVINDPKGTGAETFAATKEQVEVLSARLAELKGEAAKVKSGFASADEAIAAFNRHMNEMPTERVISQAETLARTESERLRQAFEESTQAVDSERRSLDSFEQEIQESIQEVERLEQELAKLQQRQAKRQGLVGRAFGTLAEGSDGKRQAMIDGATADNLMPWTRSENRRMRRIQEQLEGNADFMGARKRVSFAQQQKAETEELLVSLRLEQAERRAAYEEAIAQEERLRSAEQARFEQEQQGQRMTREEMQNAIKVIEDEALTVDRTTAEGQQRWEGMRATIDKMNEELRTATGEWMSLQQAEELAATAGGKDFIGTQQQLSQATAAMERYRESLVRTVQQKKRDGEATTEEEAKLKRLENELKNLRFEQDHFNMSHQRMDDLLKKPKSAKDLEELKAAIKRADGELKRMEDSLGKNNSRYQEMAREVKQAKIELGKMEQQSKATASSFEKAWSRLKTYVGLYVGAAVAMQKIVATMGDLMELSDKMGEVRKTTGFTADEVGRLTTSLAKLDTRTSITGLTELAAVAGQLGLKTEQDVRGFTEAANMLMVALPEMGKEGATAMLKVALATGEIDKIRQQMQDGLVEGSDAVSVAMTKIGSTIDSLRANSAAAAPAITDFVKRVGAVGAQSGITIDQVAALGSTVDALGMRVEMSATALSRMIPAIKNNAFEIAKAIGVTPDTIRGLFDAGRGMEAILMILQHIKDSNLDEDGIEKMMGMGGMADIMKDLNQQGARAGIVFAGLSQNVDELRRQLGVARNAYVDNIAIQNEYNKMNETTAAKWERLKNQVEEVFVGDRGQRGLGWIIDRLRDLIDLLTGDNGVSASIRTVILAIGLLRLNIIGGLVGAIKTLYTTVKSMSWVGWANLITSVGLAIWYLGEQLDWFGTKTSAASDAVGNLEKELKEETTRLDQSFRALSKYTAELDNAKKKLDEVRSVSKDTADAETALQKAQEKHDASIREINSKYGKYLGYMLSETSSAVQLAKARELINAKLRETITLKQREAALGNVEQEYGSGVRKAATSTDKLVQQYFGGNYDAAARVSIAISEAAEKYANDSKKFNDALAKAIRAEQKFIDPKQIAKMRSNAAKGGITLSDDDVLKSITHNLSVRADGLREAVGTYNEQVEVTERTFEARTNVQQKKTKQATIASLNSIKRDWDEALSKYQKASGEERAKLAVEVYKQQRAYTNLYNNYKDYFDKDKKNSDIAQKSIERMQTYEKGLRKVAEEGIKAVDAAERAESIIQETNFTGGGDDNKNPWGGGLPAESTDWKNMTAEQLVARRKQMKDFVNAIQTDTDVQSVLKEDAALRKAIEGGMSSDMRTVIEWYNTERLKIQDELHARHLTNTGDWMDPSKQKGRKKRLEDEWKYYLDELDAYYTERKTRIQEAGTDEGVTEAEVQNRTLANEMEWRQRRAELQKLYANKSAQVTADEQQAIYDILASRTGDTAKFVRQDIAKTVGFILKIGEKSRVEMDRLMGRLDKGIEQDFLKQQQAVTKQMKAIQDIIDKERPFNGITKNMRENLVTMGILTADMTAERNKLMAAGEDMSGFNMRQASEEAKRTAWLLGQAEEAYTLTVEEMMRRMADAGMAAWADELRRNPEMQEALLAQLHQTYDKVQEAIKKEASLVKKEMDIWWNDIESGQTQSRKGGFEAMLTSLGLAEDQVKRANALIGAGQASERVADRLAIKQMQVRLTMQETYYAKMRQMWADRIAALRAQGKELDAQHAEMSRNLALSEEQKKLDEQRVAIANQIEESQNRLYKELREWGELISGSVLSVMEASNAGQADFYTEQAKKRLTGESTYGRYVVVENAGTADASASYRTLSDEEVLRIEQQNAMADAWKKAMDDIAEKMNQTITDQVNAMMQNASIDANTDALGLNTEAIAGLTAAMGGGEGGGYKATNDPKIQALNTYLQGKVNPAGGETAEKGDAEGMPKPFWQMTGEDVEQAKVNTETLWQHYTETGTEAMQEMSDGVSAMPNVIQPFNMNEEQREASMQGTTDMYDAVGSASDAATARQIANQNKVAANEQRTDTQMTKSSASMFAKMTQAANLYGIAYQTMSNDNLSSTQKFEMMAIQAAGQAGISALQVSLAKATGQTVSNLPAIGSEAFKINPIAGAAIFAAISAVLGGLLGLAASKVAKSKAEIASVTGAAASAGRLSTGMMTYAKGNVDAFTDPSSLREGRTYNVDAADGRTYRARYMGRNPRTHITNGPEFHLSGERGREMIIDADTTHQIVYNEPAVMQVIKTLSGTRGAYGLRRGRQRGMAAFADGNVADLVEIENGEWAVDNASSAAGMSMEMATSLQASIDRNSEVLERAMAEGFKGVFVINGKGGLVDSYDKGKKEAMRHGQKY